MGRSGKLRLPGPCAMFAGWGTVRPAASAFDFQICW